MGGESRCNTAVGGESSALDHVRDIINSPAPCSTSIVYATIFERSVQSLLSDLPL